MIQNAIQNVIQNAIQNAIQNMIQNLIHNVMQRALGPLLDSSGTAFEAAEGIYMSWVQIDGSWRDPPVDIL